MTVHAHNKKLEVIMDCYLLIAREERYLGMDVC